jgi:hypothetical protein
MKQYQTLNTYDPPAIRYGWQAEKPVKVEILEDVMCTGASSPIHLVRVQDRKQILTNSDVTYPFLSEPEAYEWRLKQSEEFVKFRKEDIQDIKLEIEQELLLRKKFEQEYASLKGLDTEHI